MNAIYELSDLRIHTMADKWLEDAANAIKGGGVALAIAGIIKTAFDWRAKRDSVNLARDQAEELSIERGRDSLERIGVALRDELKRDMGNLRDQLTQATMEAQQARTDYWREMAEHAKTREQNIHLTESMNRLQVTCEALRLEVASLREEVKRYSSA